ncbi:hypothetical protein [Streptomyces flaveus]|uniref:Uncharacterized protein n=1 Tax=Streptomyces flaveus TaxID=66370 RepID=A0A917R6D8_9ACTN|nr:hypothetical protein [Streptomyces flaveus]GGK91713.1 hypothetical protein GCM10010094_60820 [Streptomyces flaveus]
MSRDSFEGPELTDHYTDAVREVIEAKQEGHRPPKAPEPAARPGQLMDLMAALQQSVDKARAARGESDANFHEPPTTAAMETTATKTAKKSPAKKTSLRKPRRRA